MAVIRHNDVCEVGRHNLPLCDVLVGGFPCQDLSVAGKRAGLPGERSGLFFEFVRVASELRPAWLVLENVPGLLSSNEGRDFAIVQLSLEDAGYSCAWRILDSQWFGVAQRRRRLFIVGHSNPRCAGAVLFEPEGGAGDSPAVRKTGADIAHALNARTGGVSGKENQETIIIDSFNQTAGFGRSQTLSQGESGRPLVAYALNAHGGACGRINGESETFVTHTLSHEGFDASEDGTGRGTPLVGSPPDPRRVREVAGLPRGMDGRRYKQLGNAVTVPVIEWIGRRIIEVQECVTYE